MTKVVIAGFGIRGDVAPLTGIGIRLKEAGHQVLLAAPKLLADLIEGCGLEFRQWDADLDIGADLSEANPLKLVAEFVAPGSMRTMGERLLTALHDERPDVLLLSPVAELAGHQYAEARDIPSIGLRLQPLSATARHPPALLGSWSAGSAGNRAVGRLTTASVDRLYSGTIAGFREQLGLPRVSAAALRRRRSAAQWPILNGFSPEVVPRPADWRPGMDVVGYWWPQRSIGWQPPDDVVKFLDDGAPPVFVGFSSLVMTQAESRRVSAVVLQALRKAGARGVIQAGWAGLDVRADDALTIGDVPHDWLFDRVAAVVHAGGAGTTGAGLRAGQPAITVPAPSGDQPFWAQRLHELGVSAATLPLRKLTADQLVTAIHDALTDSTFRDNAKHLAARITEEDGAGQVLATVHNLIR